jgi:hypothetical protein
MVVSDLKFVAPRNATPDGFAKAIHQFGYHQSAAFYSDGIKAVYGHYPTHWVHVVVEKEPPHCVALYELPGEDIERGELLNRRAIDLFARCLERNASGLATRTNPSRSACRSGRGCASTILTSPNWPSRPQLERNEHGYCNSNPPSSGSTSPPSRRKASASTLRQRQAKMFAMSPLVPEHLRKGPPEQAIANCWIALTLARRWARSR